MHNKMIAPPLIMAIIFGLILSISLGRLLAMQPGTAIAQAEDITSTIRNDLTPPPDRPGAADALLTEAPRTPAKVELNHATLAQLDALPGIGPVKAAAIIDYRQKKGNYSTIEQLLDVKGIGAKTYENIKDLVWVE
ncbi:MAG: helix-hairpin-helix domain-containing protein [Clostridiales bacterium]